MSQSHSVLDAAAIRTTFKYYVLKESRTAVVVVVAARSG